MTDEAVRKLLCTFMREKPETMRASRKLGKIDFSKIEHMGLNENVFGMSPKAIAAMAEAAPHNNFYADWTQEKLKNAIGEHYGVDPEFILTGCGSSALTDAIGVAFLEKGDEVLMCMPTFPAFVDTAHINGASVVTIPTNDDLTLDMDGLLENITDKTKLVYICNPNNPTGTYIGIDKLNEFAKKCPDHVIQVYDEAYIEFAEADDCQEMVETMKAMPEKPIICLKTFSKFYGMAGVRAGYVLAQPEIITYLAKSGGGQGWALGGVSQAGAAAAMEDREHGEYVKAENARCRKYLIDEMRKLGCKVYDSQTNFIFFHPGVDPEEVAYRMMMKGIMISAQAGANRVSVNFMPVCERFIEYLGEIIGDLKKEEMQTEVAKFNNGDSVLMKGDAVG